MSGGTGGTAVAVALPPAGPVLETPDNIDLTCLQRKTTPIITTTI